MDFLYLTLCFLPHDLRSCYTTSIKSVLCLAYCFEQDLQFSVRCEWWISGWTMKCTARGWVESWQIRELLPSPPLPALPKANQLSFNLNQFSNNEYGGSGYSETPVQTKRTAQCKTQNTIITITGFSRFILSVGITTRYGLKGPGIESRWRARFSALVQTGPGAHPAFYTMGTGSFPGVKRPGCGVDHPPHLALRLRKE